MNEIRENLEFSNTREVRCYHFEIGFKRFYHQIMPAKDADKIANSVDLSRVVRKSTFYMCENKDADQLRGNREADQRLCFRYIDSAIPLLPKYEISSL